MKVEEIKTEDYILEAEERAKTRLHILGSHSAPTKKVRISSGKVSGKSGRIKQFYFKTSLSSWEQYLKHEISFDEMKALQKEKK